MHILKRTLLGSGGQFIWHTSSEETVLNALRVNSSLVGLSVVCFLCKYRSVWRMFSACVGRAHTRAHAYMHSAASARKTWSASAEAAASDSHGYPHSDCFYIPGLAFRNLTYALSTSGCNTSTAWNIFGCYIRYSGWLKSERAHLCVTHRRLIVMCAFWCSIGGERKDWVG